MLLIRHEGVPVPHEKYLPFEDPTKQVYFFDTTPFINKAILSREDIDRFWAGSNWITEAGMTREETGDVAPALCRGDAIHYNAVGYRIIGDAITKKLKEIIALNARRRSD